MCLTVFKLCLTVSIVGDIHRDSELNLRCRQAEFVCVLAVPCDIGAQIDHGTGQPLKSGG